MAIEFSFFFFLAGEERGRELRKAEARDAHENCRVYIYMYIYIHTYTYNVCILIVGGACYRDRAARKSQLEKKAILDKVSSKNITTMRA